LRIICLESKLRCVLNIINVAKHANATSKVLSFSVELKGFVDDALSFKVLSPPLVKGRFSLTNNKLLETIDHVQRG
jgi:hypothetical protein